MRIQNLLFGILSVNCVAICTGCAYEKAANMKLGDGNLSADLHCEFDSYLEEIREVLKDKNFAHDEVVGAPLTTREYRSKYEVVYADYERTFFSYREESFFYTGGAHGNTIVGVGTIDVKTGKELTIADVIPENKRAEALAIVENAVIAKIGGRENLLGEITLTENFYIAGDGLHFVFNEYEVAAYSFGWIEVVIPAYGECVWMIAE